MDVRSYGQFCPIARAAEILTMRWTPIIVRNLLLGCETFGELREGAPGIPRSLLSERLALLERYGIVAREDNPRRYRLTDAGRDLQAVIDALGIWGARWLEVAPEHLDAHLVLWSLCRQAKVESRLVIRFDLTDGPHRRFWVVLAAEGNEVCVRPPGFDDDLVVGTSTEWLVKWYTGRIALGDALHAGVMTVKGPAELVRTLARIGRGRYADVAPAVSR